VQLLAEAIGWTSRSGWSFFGEADVTRRSIT
jgi:hypothetical protein